MDWEPAERVQKNEAGEFRALIGGEWVPAIQAQKNEAGQFRVMRAPDAPASQPSFLSGIKSAAETALEPLIALGTGIPAAALGGWAGAGKELLTGKSGEPTAQAVTQALTYAPRSQGARNVMQTLASWLDDSKAAGLPVTGAELPALGQAVAQQAPAMRGAAYAASTPVRAAVDMAGNVTTKLWPGASARAERRLLTSAAGPDRQAIIAELLNAEPGVTAGQAAVGVGRREWSALDKIGETYAPTPHGRMMDAQRAADEARLAQIAGGTNREQQEATQAIFRAAVNDFTGPKRDIELQAANTAGQVLADLGPKAEARRAAAADNVQDVRRFTAAGERADALAQNTYKPTGFPRVPGRYTYADELAQRAERVAQARADESLQRGAEARFIEGQIGSLEAHGLTPLDTSKVVGHIRGVLTKPGPRMSDMNQKVLGAVEEKFQEAARLGGGVPDAYDVYMIRKQGIGEIVANLTKGEDPKQSQKLAAKYTAELKPIIDQAIEAAGGTGWTKYLDEYSTGMDVVNRMKLGGKMAELYRTSPRKFEAVAGGNAPQVIEKIMGPGTRELSAADPVGSLTYEDIAGHIVRDRTLGNQASAGMPAMGAFLSKEVTGGGRLPGMISAKVTIANRILDLLHGRANEATVLRVADTMRDPQAAARVLADPAARASLFKGVPPAVRLQIEAVLKRAVPAVVVQQGALNNEP